MAIYRVLRNISKGDELYPKGSFIHSGEFQEKSITVLEQRGLLARISAPPLEALPGWKARSTKLKPLGIIDAEAFLEVDSEKIAKLIKVKPETVDKWKQEVTDWLTVTPKKG